MSGLNEKDCQAPLPAQALQGIRLFNQGRYFEAHEALEAAWREETGSIRELYRGILQAAVVYLHITRRNYPGAIKVYQRCRKWLAPWPAVCRGVEVEKLRKDLEEALRILEGLGPERIGEFDPGILRPVELTHA
jgi:uncharacterized protein